MESLLGTFLAAGAAGGIAYLILHGIRALFGDESGSHDSNELNFVSDTTDRRREESKDRESSAVTRSNSRTLSASDEAREQYVMEKVAAPKKWDPSKIKCYKCSKQIGARAPHCVHCGAPKKKAMRQRQMILMRVDCLFQNWLQTTQKILKLIANR